MALELPERVRTFGVGSSRIANLPDLAEIQKSSFKWFIDEGLGEELRAFSPIKDYTGRLELHFLPNYTFDDHTEPNKPKTPEEARAMDASFTKKLRIQMRLVNRDIGEIKEQEIYVGDIPMMTDRGTFIINGAERVIVSQIVRSPGIYYKREVDQNGKRTFSATLIPNRGAWLKFETDVNDVIYVKIDKNRKLPATTLLRALGYSDQEMESIFRHRDFLKKTLEKDNTKTREDSLIEVYRKLRPGDPPSVAGGQNIIDSRFFDDKRYDLGKVGRYKLNKKLGLSVPETARTLRRGHRGRGRLPDLPQLRRRSRRRHRSPGQQADPLGRRAFAEPVPHRPLAPGAHRPRAHDAAGRRHADAGQPAQHQAAGGGDQGVLWLLAAVAVHGPDQSAGRADAQAPAFRARSRRSFPGAGRLCRPRHSSQPLRANLPGGDAGRPQRRPDRLAGHARPRQRVRLHRDAVPAGGQLAADRRRSLPLGRRGGSLPGGARRRAGVRQRRLPDRAHPGALQVRVHRDHARPGRLRGGEPDSDRLGGDGAHPLPRARRRQPGAHGLQHAAPARAAHSDRARPGDHGHREAGGARLRHGDRVRR